MLCPSCAAQTPPAVWSLVAGFVAVPLVVLAVAVAAVAATLRRAREPAGSTGERPDGDRA